MDSILYRLFRSCDRRTFLKSCGVAGVGLVTGGVLQGVFRVIRLDDGLHRVSLTRLAMGTFVTVTAVHESRAKAEESVGRAFEEMSRLIAVLSRHDPASPVSVLNDQGTLAGPPPELVHVTRRAVDFCSETEGAFDITVEPLVDLIKNAAEKNRGAGPTPQDVAAVLELVGSDKIEITDRRLRFRGSGMGITLDGIAKGFIVDRMSETLSALAVGNHLINAGGDILARGTRAGSRPWSVAVQNPRRSGDYPDVIELTDGAVATSGSYEIYYDGERVLHHIVDPTTGFCPGHNLSVSVRARSVSEADALATALFVLERPKGIGLVENRPGRACLVIDKEGTLHRSHGWRSTVL